MFFTVLLAALNVAAQNADTYYIKAPHFVLPLIEKWIREYKKVEPQTNLMIAKSASNKNESSLDIQLSEESSTPLLESTTVYFGAYAILPVTTKNSEADKLFAKKELNQKKLKSLLFINDDLDEQQSKQDNTYDKIVLYTGSSKLSVSNPYALYFGKDASSFKGRKIVGDDAFLNVAIQKDPNGLAFNAVPNLYDIQSRRLKNNLSIVPLNFSKEQLAAIPSLDNLISVLESTNVEGVPVEKIGFSYHNNNDAINRFVSWVLTDGQAYNHQYGLLQLKAKDAIREANKAKTLLTAQK